MDEFLASRRTESLVSRADELKQIRTSIFASQSDCEILFVRGPGGRGKSRLLEEVLWLAGNPLEREKRGKPPKSEDWSLNKDAVVIDLLDMVDINLHTRSDFMHALRDGLVRTRPGLTFSEYDDAYQKLQGQRVMQGSFPAQHKAIEDAEAKFIQCYRQTAANRRIVITLDTAEKLAYSHSQWLIDAHLITTDELTFNTTQWLCRQIENGNLPNTTLLLVGRQQEGGPFFDLIERAIEKAKVKGISVHQISILPQPFTLIETQEYISRLAEVWGNVAHIEEQFQRIAGAFAALTLNSAQVEVLWRYTGGEPVRLGLYADLIVDSYLVGNDIPEPFLDRPDDAEKRASNKLAEVQRIIEKDILSLFTRPSLRAQILQALVRSPRGLDSEQLAVVLSNAEPDARGNIKPDPDLRRLIETELEAIYNLSIVKVRPQRQFIDVREDSEEETEESEDGEQEEEIKNKLRLGLQGEIYTIYAVQMDSDERNREEEKRARLNQYKLLQAWAVHQRRYYERRRKLFQTDDERKILFQSPANARKVTFPQLSTDEQLRRDGIRTNIQSWQQEELHYALLIDLRENLNEIAFELGYAFFKANDEESDAIVMEEIYQVIEDRQARRFIDIPRWSTLQDNQEPIKALSRFVRQMELIRWMQRFVLRNQYERAIQFCTTIDDKMENFSAEEQISWKHTFARGERQIWAGYAQMMQSHDYGLAISQLKEIIRELEILASAKGNQLAFPERQEHGFIGHAASNRLKKVISLAYNYIGYGDAQLGNLRKAVRSNGKSLRYMRETRFRAQMAVTLNDLSRVLSDMGRRRARRICLDGLKLRKDEGAEIPIAYSLNTLALIDNDNLRPDLAWREAATAMAYFERAGDQRGLGLALLQLGEALRRLAAEEQTGLILPDPPEFILRHAGTVLSEAVSIFSEGPAAAEVLRRVEALIELGCLLRDQIQYRKVKTRRRQIYADALSRLDQARRLAQQNGWERLDLDAWVNIVWTHYYFGKSFKLAKDRPFAEEYLLKAQKELKAILENMPAEAVLTPSFIPDVKLDRLYLFKQLSKLHGLDARIELEQFKRRVELLDEDNARLPREQRREIVHSDPTARDHLHKSAEAFVLALAYAQLFSPRSSALSSIYDYLYDELKFFNLRELSDFKGYQYEAVMKYHTGFVKDRMEDLSDLNEFLKECFGIQEED